MALATRCPHCNTTFRVAHDQLKLRAGLVRCGACKEIFNGIEHLLPQDGLTPAQAPSPSSVPSASPDSSAPSAPPAPQPPEPQPVAEPENAAEAESEPEAAKVSASESSETDVGNEQERAVEEDTFPTSPPSPPSSAIPEAPALESKAKSDLDEIPDFSEFLQLAEAAADDTPTEAPPREDARKDTNTVSPPASADHDEAEAAEPPHGVSFDDDPLTRMTLMDFHDRQEMPSEAFPHTQPAGDEVDSIEKTIDELRSRPDRRKPPARRPRNMETRAQAEDEPVDAIDAAEEAADISIAEEVEEPSFVRKARRRERFGPLIAWTLGVGSVLLTLALAGQGIYTFRNQLAARLPKAKPMLIKACVYAGCRVSLPMQIDAISIEANELQSTGAAKDIFVLTTILRNRSSLTQAWPNLELTLKDTNGKPLVRRVFLPSDYLLDPQDVARGFAPATEQQLKLVFNLAQPDSSGYEVAIFYP